MDNWQSPSDDFPHIHAEILRKKALVRRSQREQRTLENEKAKIKRVIRAKELLDELAQSKENANHRTTTASTITPDRHTTTFSIHTYIFWNPYA